MKDIVGKNCIKNKTGNVTSKKKNVKANNHSKVHINNTINKQEEKKITKIHKKEIIVYCFCLLLLIIGISYSFFNYTRTGPTNEVVVGEIYLHYSTDRTITLQNVEPRNSYDPSVYIEFTIDGLNEYTESDIWYGIDLLYGSVPTGKTESNRIRDDLLRFTLTKNGTTVLNGRGYDDLQNLRLYVETIPASSSNEVSHTYRLYVWITDEINVGNSRYKDYTMSEWNDLFASIKIRVIGDFIEKEKDNSVKVTFNGNGGTPSKPYKYVSENSLYGDLPVASRPAYKFNYWHGPNSTRVLSTDRIQSNSDHSLKAIWSEIKYIHIDEFTFDGTNYIDTEVPLFDEDNIHQNFYMEFEIDQNNSANSNATLVSSMLENSQNLGFKLQRNGSNNNYQFLSNVSSNTNYSRTGINYSATKVRIIRINDIIYYSVDDEGFISCGNFTNFDDCFNTPVTLGASLTENGTAHNFFTGTMSNILIEFISDEAVLSDYYNVNDGYEYDGAYNFDGNNYIDTGVYLFNQANINRNFHISFEITTNSSTDNNATIVNSKNDLFYGLTFRKSEGRNFYYLYVKSSDVNYRSIDSIPYACTKIEFLRIDGKLYYSFNETNFIEIIDYSGFTDYFNVPVIFGANVSENRTASNYFKGSISDIVVEFISDDATVEDYNYYDSSDKYEYFGDYVFDGTNYINTGVSLFSRENAARNFYMSFEIKVNNSNSYRATVMSAKNENGSPWPGVDFRRNNNSNEFYSKATAKSGVAKELKGISWQNTKKVQFLRINKVLYYSIDSINNGAFTLYLDFSQFTSYFDIPVIFGSALNTETSRNFRGTLSNMVVEFISDDAQLSDYE